MEKTLPKHLIRFILGLFFVLAGLNHFRVPSAYAAMMPAWVPWPAGVSAIAAIGEILGGIGVMLPEYRRAAGWCLVALLIAVFPANLHAALMGHVEGFSYSPGMLWVRLPLQAVLVAWVAWVSLAKEPRVVI